MIIVVALADSHPFPHNYTNEQKKKMMDIISQSIWLPQANRLKLSKEKNINNNNDNDNHVLVYDKGDESWMHQVQ